MHDTDALGDALSNESRADETPVDATRLDAVRREGLRVTEGTEEESTGDGSGAQADRPARKASFKKHGGLG